MITAITWFVRILGGFLLLVSAVPVVARLDDCPEDETPQQGPHGRGYSGGLDTKGVNEMLRNTS